MISDTWIADLKETLQAERHSDVLKTKIQVLAAHKFSDNELRRIFFDQVESVAGLSIAGAYDPKDNVSPTGSPWQTNQGQYGYHKTEAHVSSA